MEHQARLAVQQYLKDNENTFFQDIIVHGQQRGWGHVTISGATPPTAYYFASIFVEEAPVEENIWGQNVQISTVKGTYNVSIVIVDYMEGVAGETELYETMDVQFQVVTDRVKFGIFDTGSFIYDATYDAYESTYDAVMFRLPTSQRVVNKGNTLVRFPEAEEYYAVVATQISFQLEECIDS